MGDIADMMLEGDLCHGCGVYLPGDSDGLPRYCRDCLPAAVKAGNVLPKEKTDAQRARAKRKRKRQKYKRNKAARKAGAP
jgi:hypothetical protein